MSRTCPRCAHGIFPSSLFIPRAHTLQEELESSGFQKTALLFPVDLPGGIPHPLEFEEWGVAGLPWWFLGDLRSNSKSGINGSTDTPQTNQEFLWQGAWDGRRKKRNHFSLGEDPDFSPSCFSSKALSPEIHKPIPEEARPLLIRNFPEVCQAWLVGCLLQALRGVRMAISREGFSLCFTCHLQMLHRLSQRSRASLSPAQTS